MDEKKLCPFNRMKPCAKEKCALWRVDRCVFMNIDGELFAAVDIMLGYKSVPKEENDADSATGV